MHITRRKANITEKSKSFDLLFSAKNRTNGARGGKNAKKVRKSITDFLDQFDNFTYKLFIIRKLFE